ncbi:MAG: alpha/beta fold hydrolase [Chloroflexi bacterium]|nr:alpha/beta fold hydrolase [Chloroflexota bacterium]
MPQHLLDRPEVLAVLFHPRRESSSRAMAGVELISVPVEPGVSVGGRLYRARRESPIILYFHGNGEIAADYDDLAPLYTEMGITLLVMDYRGYGTSDGTPTATNLIADAMASYNALGRICDSNDLAPARRYLMGRSLGSAAALEVASRVPDGIAGLIIVSGFANTFQLLARLGLRISGASEERDGAGNLAKINRIAARTLIIHGEEDFLIPISEAEELYKHSGATENRLVRIPNAGHNDLMVVGMRQYFGAIRDFVRA